MLLLDILLSWTGFTFVAIVCVFSPWCFGAWEMWWFWPFAVCIFIVGLLFAGRLLIRAVNDQVPALCPGPRATKARLFTALTFVPFLVYAAVRAAQAPVFMDAERSFLMFATPLLLGTSIVFGFRRKQLDALFLIVLLNLILLGLYGLINHLITGSRLVLWVEGFPQYLKEHRATGSYFCPDHFAGAMELALCLGLALLLARETTRLRRTTAALVCVLALSAVVLSKSRGGGLAVIVVLAAALLWGLAQWPAVVRWWCRGAIAALAVFAVVLFAHVGTGYMTRFGSYFGWQTMREQSFRDWRPVLANKLRGSMRGRMMSAAVRAWRTSPVVGIGPGMHQNLWPHFAASPDGNRERGIWPTYPNNRLHSYKVHSDWLELLEEYGVVGLALFLIPVGAGFTMLLRGLYRTGRRDRESGTHVEVSEYHIILAAVLGCTCMAFHSFGDFNLQIPATTWMLTALVAIALAHTTAARPLRGSTTSSD